MFGTPNVRELQSKLTAADFIEWVAYDNVVGLPDSWLQFARLAHCFNGVKIEDFIPTKKAPMSDQQIWQAFRKQASQVNKRYGQDS